MVTLPLPALRGRGRVLAITAASVASLTLLSSCGDDTPAQPAAKAVELTVQPAKLTPPTQRPGDAAILSITVTNSGSAPVDHVAVTLSGIYETRIAARANANPNDIPQGTSDLPSAQPRPAWFIDEGPNNTPLAGGDTWDAGPLAAGRTKTFKWTLTALTTGSHTLRYEVTGGLTDAQAKKTSGTGLSGTVKATILKR